MAKINEIDITSLTFQEGSAPTTPASTKWKLYTKTDGLYVVDDAGTETGPLGAGGGGSGTVPQWIEYLAARQSGETSHADDDFFDDATKTGWTETTVSGNATWTEKYDLLSAKVNSQTSGDAAFILKSLTPSSAPVTIETAMTTAGDGSNYTWAGICFTDGTAASSKTLGFGLFNADLLVSGGTLTDILSTVNNQFGAFTTWFGTSNGFRLYIRLVWTAANTFEMAVSPNGVSWSSFGEASQAFTMTPTHVGFFATSYGSSVDRIANFDYLRVNASDLSP